MEEVEERKKKLASLTAMGFPEPQAREALAACGDSLEDATIWLIDRPAAPRPQESPPPPLGSQVEAELLAMGFGRARVQRALRLHGASLDEALAWLVEDGDDGDGDDAPAAKAGRRDEPAGRAAPARLPAPVRQPEAVAPRPAAPAPPAPAQA